MQKFLENQPTAAKKKLKRTYTDENQPPPYFSQQMIDDLNQKLLQIEIQDSLYQIKKGVQFKLMYGVIIRRTGKVFLKTSNEWYRDPESKSIHYEPTAVSSVVPSWIRSNLQSGKIPDQITGQDCQPQNLFAEEPPIKRASDLLQEFNIPERIKLECEQKKKESFGRVLTDSILDEVNQNKSLDQCSDKQVKQLQESQHKNESVDQFYQNLPFQTPSKFMDFSGAFSRSKAQITFNLDISPISQEMQGQMQQKKKSSLGPNLLKQLQSQRQIQNGIVETLRYPLQWALPLDEDDQLKQECYKKQTLASLGVSSQSRKSPNKTKKVINGKEIIVEDLQNNLSSLFAQQLSQDTQNDLSNVSFRFLEEREVQQLKEANKITDEYDLKSCQNLQTKVPIKKPKGKTVKPKKGKNLKQRVTIEDLGNRLQQKSFQIIDENMQSNQIFDEKQQSSLKLDEQSPKFYQSQQEVVKPEVLEQEKSGSQTHPVNFTFQQELGPLKRVCSQPIQELEQEIINNLDDSCLFKEVVQGTKKSKKGHIAKRREKKIKTKQENKIGLYDPNIISLNKIIKMSLNGKYSYQEEGSLCQRLIDLQDKTCIHSFILLYYQQVRKNYVYKPMSIKINDERKSLFDKIENLSVFLEKFEFKESQGEINIRIHKVNQYRFYGCFIIKPRQRIGPFKIKAGYCLSIMQKKLYEKTFLKIGNRKHHLSLEVQTFSTTNKVSVINQSGQKIRFYFLVQFNP